MAPKVYSKHLILYLSTTDYELKFYSFKSEQRTEHLKLFNYYENLHL
jgi:hypothetical protein